MAARAPDVEFFIIVAPTTNYTKSYRTLFFPPVISYIRIGEFGFVPGTTPNRCVPFPDVSRHINNSEGAPIFRKHPDGTWLDKLQLLRIAVAGRKFIAPWPDTLRVATSCLLPLCITRQPGDDGFGITWDERVRPIPNTGRQPPAERRSFKPRNANDRPRRCCKILIAPEMRAPPLLPRPAGQVRYFSRQPSG